MGEPALRVFAGPERTVETTPFSTATGYIFPPLASRPVKDGSFVK